MNKDRVEVDMVSGLHLLDHCFKIQS